MNTGTGVSTQNIPALSAVDELVGNQSGRGTGRIKTSELAKQLSVEGALAERLNEVKESVATASQGYVIGATWAALTATNGTRQGQPGRVPVSDKGSHVDPVTSLNVRNSGEYLWNMTPAGWRRVGDLLDFNVLAEVNGTWAVKQIDDNEFVISDPAGHVAFRAGSNGMSFGSGLVVPIEDDRVILTDEFGWIKGEIAGNKAVDNGEQPQTAFSFAEIAALDARALAMSAAIMNSNNTFTTRLTAKYNHVIEYGQSLSIATEAWPVKSKTAMFGNVSFGENVLPKSLAVPTFQPHGSAAFYPLIAKVQSGATLLDDTAVAALAPGNAATGEAISIGFANFAKHLHNLHHGVANDETKLLVVSSCGRGGQTIAQLSKGASPEHYGRVPDVAAQVKQLATNNDTTYGVAAFLWEQGEHDYIAGTTKAEYKSKFIQLYNNLKNDVAMSVVGQKEMPIFLTYQTGGSYANDSQELAIANAQLELSNEIPEVVMYGPVYPVTDKGGHLSANGSRWLGMQAAKVFHRVVTMGLNWKPLQPINAVIRSREILIEHHVPKPPLQFLSPYVVSVATDYTNKGFRVTDDSGTVVISSVEIVGNAVVRINLARETLGVVKVWYADKTTHNGNGCLADSDDTRSILNYEYQAGSGDYPETDISELVNQPYPLNNWCVAYVMTAKPA